MKRARANEPAVELPVNVIGKPKPHVMDACKGPPSWRLSAGGRVLASACGACAAAFLRDVPGASLDRVGA